MINTNETMSATPWATPACVSYACVHALLPVGSGTGASFEGRLTVAGIQSITAARVPAFLKDVVPGVRAWSPPV
jgi:hypothetical protein